ncbi:MAG: ABC transporter transmembrane domain-containing protein [Cytophagales bacterium]|nr:ABC transporter transmembrane domain-containing protein [Cytophagales bacterium]MDW8383816.1 ABC transporter transmembrane domain-containing protein [Flammeovirgaceae bacterium]
MALHRQSLYENAPKAKINLQGIRRLIGIYRFMLPYKGYFLMGLVCLFFSSTVLLAFPYLAGKLIDIANGKTSRLFSNMNQVAYALASVLGIQSLFSFLRIVFFAQVNERAMSDIRIALFERYLQLPMSFYDTHRVGELMSRISTDVAMLQDTFSITIAELFRQTAILIGGLCILFITNPQLTVFMLAIVPILALLSLLFGKFIRKLSKSTQDKLAKASIITEEILQSIQTVKAFTNEVFEINRYRRTLQDFVATALKTSLFRGAFVSFIIFALFGGIVTILWYGSQLVYEGKITTGELTSFIIYTMFIGGSIGGLGDILSTLQKAIGASERVEEILLEAIEPYRIERFQQPIVLHKSIRFENVSFAYPTRSEINVLQNISFEIRAGEKVALVGHSGAGKSTIAQLLLRFYEPTFGTILWDEKNILNFPLGDYRGAIGVVPQEILLFGGTIRENIQYGKPSATEEEIVWAAKQANAWDFICSFPDGLDTIVGERGVKLSGGQRQRIAIARAMLKNPALLILDEATSALDAESEYLVQQSLERLMESRTTIIIAHRLSTIRYADKIVVMQGGRIIEIGSHESLLQNERGEYRKLVDYSDLESKQTQGRSPYPCDSFNQL